VGYVDAVADLVSHYQTMLQPKGIPLVVNTAGWVKGAASCNVVKLYKDVAASLTGICAIATKSCRHRHWAGSAPGRARLGGADGGRAAQQFCCLP